jgi:prevent-host-death family protein
MRRATITEAKNGLSALIDRVKAGETILITERGVPVARLEPTIADDDEGRLARLERAGIVRRGRGDPRWILDRPPTKTIDGSSVVELLIGIDGPVDEVLGFVGARAVPHRGDVERRRPTNPRGGSVAGRLVGNERRVQRGHRPS